MTWTKLSDDFSDDCEILSDAAHRLHVDGLVWSNRKLLNCRIPLNDLRRFAKRPEAVTELLEQGWWSLEGEEYLIVHHAAYQRERDAVIRQQAVNSVNGAKGGRKVGPPRERVPRTRPFEDSAAAINDSEPLSESSSESPSKRDGPGQAGIAINSEVEKSQPAEDVTRDLSPAPRYETFRDGNKVIRRLKAS